MVESDFWIILMVVFIFLNVRVSQTQGCKKETQKGFFLLCDPNYLVSAFCFANKRRTDSCARSSQSVEYVCHSFIK